MIFAIAVETGGGGSRYIRTSWKGTWPGSVGWIITGTEMEGTGWGRKGAGQDQIQRCPLIIQPLPFTIWVAQGWGCPNPTKAKGITVFLTSQGPSLEVTLRDGIGRFQAWVKWLLAKEGLDNMRKGSAYKTFGRKLQFSAKNLHQFNSKP